MGSGGRPASSPCVTTPGLAGGCTAPGPHALGTPPITPGGALPRTPRGGSLLRSTGRDAAVTERKEKLIANRKRNANVSFKLTPYEKRQFETKRKLSGLTTHEFVMTCIANTPVIIRPGANRLIIEIKRVGNNLNQIAHKVNAGQVTDCRDELRSIQNELTEIRNKWQS